MTIPLGPRIYLASRSPRRRELLSLMGVQFETLLFRNPPRADGAVDETPLAGEDPVAYVKRVARAKAEHGLKLVVWRRQATQPILAADTTVECRGEILGKPTDEADARRMLELLSGQRHRVLTAVSLAWSGHIETVLSESIVQFRELEEAEIGKYIASGEPMDKAGAYGIQGKAGMFVERLEGSYTGVMGLPLCETGALLKMAGYPL
ncbi:MULTISPECIES: Maf family protein [Azospira]|jgi:septum formation protein|uniref:dTTP/UTP pyrophosphatase n=1 Tax=Azospira oryzae TaxID=146939 RepID=A0ABY0IPI0_9RHOO|nr:MULTISPECIES: Maf family protein [Azospira]MDK9691971.1 Maf family nucleotide pyrophosphatase [Azospira sp.]RZT76797.1 septum formation protein [Azospira oryzae]